jgi:hypothetical protein
MKYVIPADAQASDVAFQGKTWQQVADEARVPLEQFGSQWCVDNHVDGLGIAADYVTPPDPGPPVRTLAELAAEFASIESVADVEAFRAALEALAG